jgi:hypothetical protein
MQCLFEQHPSLLRTLLDTGDSLLVFCSRFATLDLEWTIGMRERDLRAWLAHLDIDTKQAIPPLSLPYIPHCFLQLLELTQQGLRQRPAFLGGNRLGIVLMELRREFILRGIFPQQLPELSMPLDAVLGTDSPAENYVPSVQFDPLDLGNYAALWASEWSVGGVRDSIGHCRSIFVIGEAFRQYGDVAAGELGQDRAAIDRDRRSEEGGIGGSRIGLDRRRLPGQMRIGRAAADLPASRRASAESLRDHATAADRDGLSQCGDRESAETETRSRATAISLWGNSRRSQEQ